MIWGNMVSFPFLLYAFGLEGRSIREAGCIACLRAAAGYLPQPVLVFSEYLVDECPHLAINFLVNL